MDGVPSSRVVFTPIEYLSWAWQAASTSQQCVYPWQAWCHGPLARYVTLRVAHAPGMPRTFSLPPTSNENARERPWHASRHVRDARALMHVGVANPRWRWKCSRHSRRMRNPQFYVSGKGPIKWLGEENTRQTYWGMNKMNAVLIFSNAFSWKTKWYFDSNLTEFCS